MGELCLGQGWAELWDCVPQGSLSLLTFDFPKGNFPQQSPAQLPQPVGLSTSLATAWCVGAGPAQGCCSSTKRCCHLLCAWNHPRAWGQAVGTALRMLLGQHHCPSSQRTGLDFAFCILHFGFWISHPTRTAASAGSSCTKAPQRCRARNSSVQHFPVAAELCSARAGGFPCALEPCPGAFP